MAAHIVSQITTPSIGVQLDHTVTAGSATSYTVAIPTGYSLIKVYAKYSLSGGGDTVFLRLNNDAGANYTDDAHVGAQTAIEVTAINSNEICLLDLNLMFDAASTVVMAHNATGAATQLYYHAGNWGGAAVTSIKIYPTVNHFINGSIFTTHAYA